MRLDWMRAAGRSPAQYALAIGTIALAAGANAAMLALAYTLWLRPLPIAAPDRLAVLHDTRPGGTQDWFQWSVARAIPTGGALVRVAGQLSPQQALGDFRPALTLDADGPPLDTTAVTAGYFETLGVAVRGSTFVPADDDPGAPPSVILSDALWRRRFGGRDAIIGTTVSFGSIKAIVRGIAPPGFRGPRVGDATDIWLSMGGVPAATGLPPTAMRIAPMTIYVRLGDGVSTAAATAEVQAALNGRSKPYLLTLADAPYPASRADRAVDDRRLVALLAAVSALLFIVGAASLAGLSVAQTLRRRREMAIRTALGATRARLARLLAREWLALAVPGWIAATAAAFWMTHALGAFVLPSGTAMPAVMAGTYGFVLAAAAAGTLALATVGAVLPLLRLPLQNGGAVGLLRSYDVTARQPGRTGGILLAVHVAVCAVLLVGALLFIRTVDRARSFDLGFDRHAVIETIVQPRAVQYIGRDDGFAARAADFRDFESRIGALPGVAAVTHGALPYAAALSPDQVRAQAARGATGTIRRSVGPGYAGAAGLRLLAGRDLGADDVTLTDPRPVLVNQSFAAATWPGVDALGRTFTVEVFRQPPQGRQVVGVVADAYRTGLRSSSPPTVYEPVAIDGRNAGQTSIGLVVRMRPGATDPRPAIASLVRQMFPSAVQTSIRTADDVVAGELEGERLTAMMLGSFSSIGVLLALLGVFAIVSLTIAARTHEFGVRLALGSSRGSILALVVRTGLWPVAAGVAAGLAAALASSRIVAAHLFGVSAHDPLAYAVTALVIVAAGAAACLWPARRLRDLDPSAILRSE